VSRILKGTACAVALTWGLGIAGVVRAQPAGEVKELDKLEGYQQLPGEKKVKKLIEAVPNQPMETMIVWSEAKPTSGAAPLTVEFSADPPEGAKSPTYAWNFGDGSTGEGAKASHTYDKPGLYRVMLKVSDASGSLGEDEQRIKVTK
jgi:hypothetical protein